MSFPVQLSPLDSQITTFDSLVQTNDYSETKLWGQHQVSYYVNHSGLQSRWAFSFLGPHLLKLHGNENILDAGCGDGKTAATISRLISHGQVTGMDYSQPMLDYAQKQYCKAEYPNLQFELGSFLDNKISKTFDLIYSICAFQYCENEEEGLVNLSKNLNPNGKILIANNAMTNKAFKDACDQVCQSEKWASYFENDDENDNETELLNQPFEQCQNILNQHRLKLIRKEVVSTTDPFISRDDLIHFLYGSFHTSIPSENVNDFYNELVDTYIRIDPTVLHDNGVIDIKSGRMEIEIIKV